MRLFTAVLTGSCSRSPPCQRQENFSQRRLHPLAPRFARIWTGSRRAGASEQASRASASDGFDTLVEPELAICTIATLAIAHAFTLPISIYDDGTRPLAVQRKPRMRRSIILPKLSTSTTEEDSISSMADAGSSFKIVPGHSRTSSASSITSPITPTFSSRHNRWPSSSSSLATTPDSPANPAKSALGDLVEDPAERDDLSEYDEAELAADEPLCICRLSKPHAVLL